MLASLAAVLIAPLPPAFVDGRQLVRLAVPSPLRLDQVRGQVSVTVNGRPVRVSNVVGAGEPEKVRTAPREPGRVVLAGTVQSALGEREWDPDGETTLMTKLADGVFGLAMELPKGHFEFKVARNGSWAENWGVGFAPGGGNIALEVPTDQTVVFVEVDFNKKTVRDSLNTPGLKLDLPVRRKSGASSETRFSSFAVTVDGTLGLQEGQVQIAGQTWQLVPRTVLEEDEFQPGDSEFGVKRHALASTDRDPGTLFCTWTPLADSAEVLVEDQGHTTAYPMAKQPRGVWVKTVPGDHPGAKYRYRFHWRGETREAADIWGQSATPDGQWSIVPDLPATHPPHWDTDQCPHTPRQTDAILYELSVRDFTALPSSGVKPEWRGKYLGMVQPGTTTPDGKTVTGLDHLKKIGVTHVHLLPTQSFLNKPGEYTWGYATNLFNVPEESYATDGATPNEVIHQYKQMVQGFHQAGIGVVMDVVYNHTWPPEGKDSAFEQTVPHYFLREDDFGRKKNESGVGNALADEHRMARNFVRESLTYWLREYHVDGFRFDLLGMFHPSSVSEWAEACRRVRPDVILYGEPWTGGGPTYFPKGAQKGMGVGVFNDDFRNAIRGELDGPGKGFAMGDASKAPAFTTGFYGSTSTFAQKPDETINYFSAHDNMTWWDKVHVTLPNATADDKLDATKRALAAVLLARGVPFIEGGVEIGRTKGGDHNSYAAGDAVNGFDWDRAKAFASTTDYFARQVALRKAHALIRANRPSQPEVTAMQDGFRFTLARAEDTQDDYQALSPVFWMAKPTGFGLSGNMEPVPGFTNHYPVWMLKSPAGG